LIVAGFIVTLAGIGLLLALYKATKSVWVFAPASSSSAWASGSC
jgi:hypothetical protein